MIAKDRARFLQYRGVCFTQEEPATPPLPAAAQQSRLTRIWQSQFSILLLLPRLPLYLSLMKALLPPADKALPTGRRLRCNVGIVSPYHARSATAGACIAGGEPARADPPDIQPMTLLFRF